MGGRKCACLLSAEYKNAGDRSLPRTRYSRNASIYDLHEKAGGLPLHAITAPNIHRQSKQRREVCKQAGKSNVPIKKCGSK